MLVSDLGEEGLLEQISAIFADKASRLTVPIGDDATVFDCPPGTQQVWTTDLILEGVHFQRPWLTPAELGRKSLAVNLSDLAAMGARPGCALLSMALPPDTQVEYVTDFCRGFSAMAGEVDMPVAGGDTCRADRGLMVSVTAGGTVPVGGALLRSGASEGEIIYVSGFPGSAAAGMRLIEAGRSEEFPGLRKAFIAPRPRLDVGRSLAALGVGAGIDISDGIAADLRHICRESGVGAEVRREQLPVSSELKRACALRGWLPGDLALGGGEDYELLFTAREALTDRVARLSGELGVPLTRIGRVTGAAAGVVMMDGSGAGTAMPLKGYDHFRKDG